MKNLFYAIVFLSVLSASIFGQSNSSLEGSWLGAIEVSGVKLRIVLKITKTGDGYTAKLDSPDQGAKDLPTDSITRKDKTVNFSAAQFGMNYEGTLNEKEDEISGTLKGAAGNMPLNFKRATENFNAKKRPQDPAKPYPYNEEEVVYKNVKDNVRLAGTLTLPRGGEEGKFPAVILITGSGAQDRDSTVFEHRPFLVLADYLTRRGIAVLRVDDRGIGGSDLGSLAATTENFVGDVLAGVEFLKNRREINRAQIGLIGHSEGGIIAPMAAVRSKDVRFIVMLAGSGQIGADVILTQLALIGKGEKPETVAQAIGLQKNLFAIIKSEPDNQIAERKIGEMLAKRRNEMSEPERRAFAATEANVKAQSPALLSSWYRFFLAYDPRPTLEKVRVPVLALNGENDVQVSAKENLEIIAAALKAGGNKDYTIKSLPKLNHLFQTSRTGSTSEYGIIEETISPQVLELISDWILKRVGEK